MISKTSVLSFAFDKPIISDAFLKKRIEIDKYTCAKLILKKEIGHKAEETLNNIGFSKCDDKVDTDTDHWEKKNWFISLNYYLWSRKDHLHDIGDDYESLQKEVIEKYIERDGFPNDKKTSSEFAITLDANNTNLPAVSLESVLTAREAVLAPPMRTISQNVFNSILWNGLKEVRYNRQAEVAINPLNAVNSFGVAFDFYLIVYAVEGLKSGIYFYDIDQHNIDLIQPMEKEELRSRMYAIQVEQKASKTSGVAIMLTANFDRYQWRYRHEAALKHLYINCGQIVHRLMMIATAYSCKTHISPAIMDSLAMNLLELDGASHQAMYILSIG